MPFQRIVPRNRKNGAQPELPLAEKSSNLGSIYKGGQGRSGEEIHSGAKVFTWIFIGAIVLGVAAYLVGR